MVAGHGHILAQKKDPKMIISSNPRYVFIHIPKCAGTFVRKSVCGMENTVCFFGPQPHPEYGKLDHSHMPLAVVHHEFPEEFNKIREYPAFAIIRNPYSRFPSSFFQHIRLYVKPNLTELDASEAKMKLDEIMGFLDKHRDDELLPVQYIHFQRQRDYVYFNGEQVVDHLSLFEDFSGFLEDFAKITGIHLADKKRGEPKKINQSPLLYRNKFLRRLVQGPRPFKGKLFPFLPDSVKTAIKKTIYVPAKSKTNELFLSEYVRDFVRDYYRDDLDLYLSLTGGNPGSLL